MNQYLPVALSIHRQVEPMIGIKLNASFNRSVILAFEKNYLEHLTTIRNMLDSIPNALSDRLVEDLISLELPEFGGTQEPETIDVIVGFEYQNDTRISKIRVAKSQVKIQFEVFPDHKTLKFKKKWFHLDTWTDYTDITSYDILSAFQNTIEYWSETPPDITKLNNLDLVIDVIEGYASKNETLVRVHRGHQVTEEFNNPKGLDLFKIAGLVDSMLVDGFDDFEISLEFYSNGVSVIDLDLF